MYDVSAARRILAGHLTNVYADVVTVPVAVAHIRKLAAYAAESADVELERLGGELAGELEAGRRPTLVIPSLALQVAPTLEQEVVWSSSDAAAVLDAGAVAALNTAELEREAPELGEQLTETQIAEAGRPAPAPEELSR